MINEINEWQGINEYQTYETPTEAAVCRVITEEDDYGKVAVEPLSPGLANTLGNPLRRALLNSLEGVAVTWIKIRPQHFCKECGRKFSSADINKLTNKPVYTDPTSESVINCNVCGKESVLDGVIHEAVSIPHVQESVRQIIQNIKAIRFKLHTSNPVRLEIRAEGKGTVLAGDILASPDCEIVNPGQPIATLQHADAELTIELNVETGKGFRAAKHSKEHPIDTIPIDSFFAPVLRANYTIEQRRRREATDFECLTLEVWTDGTITPTDALKKATTSVIEAMNVFLGAGFTDTEGVITSGGVDSSVNNRLLTSLDLSARTQNALTRAGFERISDVLKISPNELLKIRNFGSKSYNELLVKLNELGISFDSGKSEPAAGA